MMRISWTEESPNELVLKEAYLERSVIKTIRRRQLQVEQDLCNLLDFSSGMRLIIFMVPLVTGLVLDYSSRLCLDHVAPFELVNTLSFCTNSEYGTTGCCTAASDQHIKDRYDYIQTKASSAEWSRCQSFVKEILCLRCSPFAGGIFDHSRSFPGLCTSYCNEFYDKCRNLLWFLDPTLARVSALDSRDGFCQRIAVDDAYCYPDVASSPPDPEPVPSPRCVCLQPTDRWLSMPLWAGHANDGSGRLFVIEQRGRVRILDTNTGRWKTDLFLDITDQVLITPTKGDERGLLSLAFHPDHASNRRFFLFYALERDTEEELPEEYQGRLFSFTFKVRVSEMLVREDNRDQADLTTEKIILEVFQPFQYHNGGALLFGTDGYLYASFGDGGGGGDPFESSQNKTLLHGSVVRLDVDSDTSQPYTIPPNNPFVGQAGDRPEIFSYGLRNVWRCGVDRGENGTGAGRGRILCGDVGQEGYEEMNLLTPGGNFAWPAREGPACYNNDLCGQIGPEVHPAYYYGRSVGGSVTGGAFYRGCTNRGLEGLHIFGDYRSRSLFTMNETDGNWTTEMLPLCEGFCPPGTDAFLHGDVLSFGEDDQGEIYVLTDRLQSNVLPDGRMHRIVDPTERYDPSLCAVDRSQDERLRMPAQSFIYEIGRD
ncbi:hhip-like protein 1 isoform x1 [Plakobranchus ocellatus]|uniref:Hhip-like protein 1 isoform x1 n=1 Tax=Plakobranchus ocellatus TaxID=259542 RepID=A0AAV4BC05_9GAST|nr:hhip-like protein 1 isoform x1 [Plakobranchus ocellatus]